MKCRMKKKAELDKLKDKFADLKDQNLTLKHQVYTDLNDCFVVRVNGLPLQGESSGELSDEGKNGRSSKPADPHARLFVKSKLISVQGPLPLVSPSILNAAYGELRISQRPIQLLP